ncbi:hypothetical protein J437_LFUL018880 [Ladona fulva]|uniref:Uncharacterized protein n=1 Tax=Ladona fulva TaxID=123851 RepID=A0A8K0KTD2_LADFU|nr:hypothetical protein J437_LFUL018880 [Ladona fulva]
MCGVTFWLLERVLRMNGANESSDNRNSGDTSQEELDNIYLMLDPQLHPIAPDTSCEESVKVFEQHKQEALEQLHKNMKRQLEIIKKQQQKQRLGGQYGWMPEGH